MCIVEVCPVYYSLPVISESCSSLLFSAIYFWTLSIDYSTAIYFWMYIHVYCSSAYYCWMWAMFIILFLSFQIVLRCCCILCPCYSPAKVSSSLRKHVSEWCLHCSLYSFCQPSTLSDVFGRLWTGSMHWCMGHFLYLQVVNGNWLCKLVSAIVSRICSVPVNLKVFQIIWSKA